MSTAVQTWFDLSLSQKPIFSQVEDNYEVSFYGNIYNDEVLEQYDFSTCDRSSLIELMNGLAGYFLMIYADHTTGTTYIGNDIFGNFRLYYRKVGNRLHFSDDWKILSDEIRFESGKLLRSDHEQAYFQRHRYTTGGHTLIEGIDKLMPGSLLTITDAEVSWELYLKTGIYKSSDEEYYRRRNHEIISENLTCGLQPGLKNILLFSGGVDSSFLALCLKEAKIPFTAVFMKYLPPDVDNVVDLQKSQKVADVLGLDFEIIGEPIADSMYVLESAVRRHPFDRAFSVPAYRTTEFLREKYGSCNIINGTTSDTVYCSGPSGKTIGCFIQRFLLSGYYANGNSFINSLIASFVAMIYRRRWQMKFDFKIPIAYPDYGVSLLDSQVYLPIIHTNNDQREYHQYLKKIFNEIASQLDHDSDSIRMYMKMMFIQGPTNQFPIESAKEYGHNVVIPFVDPRIVYLKMEYQNEFKNLLRPRYVLEDVLKNHFSFDTKVIDSCRKCPIDHTTTALWSEIEKEVNRQWDRISERLL